MVKFQCMVAVDITVDQALILKLTKTVSPRCSHSPHNSNFSYLCIGFMLRKPCNMVAKMDTGSSRLVLAANDSNEKTVPLPSD